MEEKTMTVTLDQLTLEVKFYLNQTAQNIIEVGKRLTQAKEMLPHGEFGKWLDSNFGLSQSSANKFMAVAERFGKSESIPNLKPTQMIQMLSLPAEETEKFIAEKTAQGTPVEDMTIKTLREEVAKYKADYETEKAKVENLFSKFEEQKQNYEAANQKLSIHNHELSENNNELKKDNGRLQAKFDAADRLANQYHVERDQLQRQLENQKTMVVEPEDYQQLKKAKVELKNKIDYLQKQLDKKTVEVVTPADYDATKKELEKLKAEQSEMVQRMDVFQKLSTVASLIQDIVKSPSLAGIQDYKREYPEEFGKMCAAFLDFTDSFYEE